MDKQVSFSAEIIEQFHSMDEPLTAQELADKIAFLEKQHGGKVKIIKSTVHIYTAYSIKGNA